MINKKNQKGEALKKLRAHIHITSTMPSAEIRHKVSRKNHSGKFRILAAENGSMPESQLPRDFPVAHFQVQRWDTQGHRQGIE